MRSNRCHRQNRPTTPSRGFTLLEVMVASSILLVIVLAVSHAVTAGQQHGDAALSDSRAAALAEATLDEVLALPYTDPDGDTTEGPDTGETTRDTFDAIDDFDGWTEAAGSITDPSGTDWPDTYQTLSREVSATYGSVTIASLGGTTTGIDLIVTVTDAAGREFTITRFIPED